MIAEFTPAWTTAANVAAWLLLQLGISLGCLYLPDKWLREEGLNMGRRSQTYDLEIYVYEKLLRIKQWKDKVPDGGKLLGGFSKGKLRSRSTGYLKQFRKECIRGEIAHWLCLAMVPFFLLWNEGSSMAWIAAYAVAANMPCIVIQRYNRHRIARMRTILK